MDRVNLVLSHQKGCVTWPESILFLMCHICWSWLAIRHGGSKSSLANVDLNCAVANCPFVVKIKLLFCYTILLLCYDNITISFQYWFSCTLAREAEERGRDPQCNIWKTSSYWNHPKMKPRPPTNQIFSTSKNEKNPCKDMNQKIPHWSKCLSFWNSILLKTFWSTNLNFSAKNRQWKTGNVGNIWIFLPKVFLLKVSKLKITDSSIFGAKIQIF